MSAAHCEAEPGQLWGFEFSCPAPLPPPLREHKRAAGAAAERLLCVCCPPAMLRQLPTKRLCSLRSGPRWLRIGGASACAARRALRGADAGGPAMTGEAADKSDLLAGNARYKKLADLNEGTFGVVMLALDRRTNEQARICCRVNCHGRCHMRGC